MQLGLLCTYSTSTYNQDHPAPGPKEGAGKKKKKKVLHWTVSGGVRRSCRGAQPTKTRVSDPPDPTARRVAVRHYHRFRVDLSGARLRVTAARATPIDVRRREDVTD